MNLKIREEDRKAVDLILDRVPTAAGEPLGSSVFASSDVTLRECVVEVEKVLGLLGNMPANDPPQDLAARTLRFIAKSTGRKLDRGQSGDYSQQQPMA